MEWCVDGESRGTQVLQQVCQYDRGIYAIGSSKDAYLKIRPMRAAGKTIWIVGPYLEWTQDRIPGEYSGPFQNP